MKHSVPLILAGLAAGCVAGLFGAGGGLVLVPILGLWGGLEKEKLFPASVAIILPVCVTVLLVNARSGGLNLSGALPYLPGSAIGGLLGGLLGKNIPAKWLHRVLGIFILWGGIRYLC